MVSEGFAVHHAHAELFLVDRLLDGRPRQREIRGVVIDVAHGALSVFVSPHRLIQRLAEGLVLGGIEKVLFFVSFEGKL